MADVDDAIMHPSEFGVGFMGIDESFEESAGDLEQIPNPGAGQFLRELSRGPLDLPNPEGIVILSARPNTGFFGDFVDDACSIFPPLWFACQKLKNFINDAFPDQVNQEITSVGSTVKAELGSPASDFLVTSFQDLWQKFADRKVINQATFQSQHPAAFKYIIVDDNANGGHVAAATMLNNPSSCVVVAFIHDVINSPKNFINRPNPIHPLTGHMDPIPMPANLIPVQNDPNRYVLYRNFAHASILALQKGYISLAGKNRIVNAIKATTVYKNCVKQASKCAPGDDEGHCDPGCAELRADVATAAVFLHREAAVQEAADIDDKTTIPCQCTAWSQWTECDSKTGISSRTCLTNSQCVQYRRCSCNDCPAWSNWDKCDSLTDITTRTCNHLGFPNCIQRRPCSCIDCDKWTDIGQCENPGDVIFQACQTPGFSICQKAKTCSCNDCPEWGSWSECHGLGTLAYRRCRDPKFLNCSQSKRCPADDITLQKEVHAEAQEVQTKATAQDIDDFSAVPPCTCSSWTRWGPCDSVTGVTTRRCLIPNNGCVQTRRCTCDDCPTWSAWDKCLSLTDQSTRTCTNSRFPNCVQNKPCTCADCQEWTRWSGCVNGVKTRQCTHIPTCTQREACTCDDCDRWVDTARCSKPNDVVIQQCRTPGLEKCERRKICTCDDCDAWSDPNPSKCTKGPGECLDIQCKTPGFEECKSRIVCECKDCPEWSDWSPCVDANSVGVRRCKTPGWDQCSETRRCPIDDLTSKKQEMRTAAQVDPAIDDEITAPCFCSVWTRWSPCDSITGVSTRKCLSPNNNCVQTRRCTCDDCPTWSAWDRCLSTTDQSTRTCANRGFPNCVQNKPCTCTDCQEWTDWSACQNGVKYRRCTHMPECVVKDKCTCDDCDRWVDTTKCSKPGDAVVQQCKTAGLEYCKKTRVCSCDDCDAWSDPNPSKCTKGPGECLDIQCKTPGFEECKSRIVCTCDDCPEWSDWTQCNGLGTSSERRCKTAGWEQCSQFKRCPADDITSKKQEMRTEAAVDTIDDIVAICTCPVWGPWTQCDSITGVSTRKCLSNTCTQTRRCTCDDCPIWSTWDKCLSLTDQSTRVCAHTRFPNCVQNKPCTCADCQEYGPWSSCVNGVRTRKCTHITGCVQTEPCIIITCALCTNWVDLNKCTKPGDVVVQQCAVAGLQCQRRRVCSCADCPDWSDWTLCSIFGGTSSRTCKTTGWEQCRETNQCPVLDIKDITSSKKRTVDAQEDASSLTFQAQAVPPQTRDPSVSDYFGGRQAVFTVSALCVFLTLAAIVIFSVMRSRQHHSTQREPIVPREDIL